MLINVRDYLNVQDALDAASDGDRVYFPSNAGSPSYYMPSSSSGWTITKRLEVFGDGPGYEADYSGTTFLAYGSGTDATSKNSSIFLVRNPLSNIYFHDFKITRSVISSPFAYGTGRGIDCSALSTGGYSGALSSIRIERVVVQNMGGEGIRLSGDDGGAHAINYASIRDCITNSNGGDGIHLENAYDVAIDSCVIGGNYGRGVYANQSEPYVTNTAFNRNCRHVGSPGVLNTTFDGNIYLRSCPIAQVHGCHFEDFNLGSVKRAVVIEDSAGGVISGCFFINNGLVDGTDLGVYVDASGQGPITILPNRFRNVTGLVNVNASAYDCVVYPQCVVSPGYSGGATIALPGGADNTPNRGLFALPSVSRLGSPAGQYFSGLAVPSGAVLPTSNLKDGMLFYLTGSPKGMYVCISGQFKRLTNA